MDSLDDRTDVFSLGAILCEILTGDPPKFREGLRALQKSMSLFDGGDARDSFFVAISEWQLGNEEQAPQWYARAVQWMTENDPENEQLVEARAETENVLGLEESGSTRLK